MAGFKENMDEFYKTVDPWGFQSNPDDQRRKEKIICALGKYAPYNRAIDLGAGEGWITKDLPAKSIFAYEISDVAKSRLPENVQAVNEPSGKYDLVIATGVLYKHYDVDLLFEIIKKHASKYVLTCNIQQWEDPRVLGIGKQLVFDFFPYRQYTQSLRFFSI